MQRVPFRLLARMYTEYRRFIRLLSWFWIPACAGMTKDGTVVSTKMLRRFVMPPQHLIPTRVMAILFLCLLGLLTLFGKGTSILANSTSDQSPRKVIVGTVMQRFWGKHPGLQNRVDQLTIIIDRMQAESEKRYGRGLDLAILPEMALSGEGEGVGEVAKWSFPLEGTVKEAFAREARKCHCYVVLGTYLLEDPATKRCSNAAILFDRSGDVSGIYRKVHLVVGPGSESLE